MKHPSYVTDAFEKIRSGEFEKAFADLEVALSTDPEDFWAWYLGAVSLGFLGDSARFMHFLDRASGLNPRSSYLAYLMAYRHLREGNLEKALWDWTRIVDLPEGWLACELVEKARKNKDLVHDAEDPDHFSRFVVFPDFFADIPKVPDPIPDESSLAEIPGSIKHKKDSFSIQNFLRSVLPVGSFRRLFYRGAVPKVERWVDENRGTSGGRHLPVKNSILILLFILIASIGFLSVKQPDFFLGHAPESLKNLLGKAAQEPTWENLAIENWANVLSHKKEGPGNQAVLYRYETRNDLIEDFEKAREKMTSRFYNQARFLLQRILYSNADFKTKEKCKIFIGFIPEPDYRDFSDPVLPSEVMKSPEFYSGALVLWEGTVEQVRDMEQGKQVRLRVREGQTDFHAEVFYNSGEKSGKWLPYSEFEKTRNRVGENTQKGVIYGTFRGLVGSQKTIYIEALRMWM